MALPRRFAEMLWDICGKAVLAIVLSASALLLHFIDKACSICLHSLSRRTYDYMLGGGLDCSPAD